MFASFEEEAITDLHSIKSKLERSCIEVTEEKAVVKQKILSIKEQKAELRRQNAEIYDEIFRNKLKLADLEKRVELSSEYVSNANKNFNKVEMTVKDRVSLKDFENEVLRIKSSIEGAINFYSSDSLQMELMKRTNNVREKRVEYTKRESEYNELVRKLEDQKRELERQKLLEAERTRQEEQLQKQLVEEQRKKDEEKKRNEFIQERQSVNTADSSNGEHNKGFSPFLDRLQTIGGSSTESPESNDPSSPPINNKPNGITDLMSFSQFFKWN